MKKQAWIIIMIAFLIGLAVYQNGSDGQNKQSAADLEVQPLVGFKAPIFQLKGMDGEMYSLAEETKPAIINFWASWCGPCELEAPELVKLYDKYRDEIEIYAVNATTLDKEKNAREFAERHEFDFPVLLDDDSKHKVIDQFEVQAYPTTFFVNRNGVIVDKVLGLVDPGTLEKKVKQMIKSK